MPLVNAKCTNCGANLQVDNTKDAAICQYCGAAYIVEKAINNYNTVNHIHANVVNIYGGNSADFIIRGGVLEKYNGASTHVVIPNSVCCIGENAFRDTYVESVHIPDSIKSIKYDAFYNCKELREIDIPNSVAEIQGRAFFNCWSLQRVTLPNRLTEIGHALFANCYNLTSINIPKSVTYIERAEANSGHFGGPDGRWIVPDVGGVGSFGNCPRLVDVNFEDLETAERLWRFFPHSPLARKKRTEEEELQMRQKEKEKEQQKQNWRRAGVCDLCGGAFKGLFSKKCTRCGKDKQY